MFGRKKEDNRDRDPFTADKFLKLLRQEGYQLKKNEFDRYYVSQSVLLDEALDGQFSKELSEDIIKPGFFTSKKVDFLGLQSYEELDYIFDLYDSHLDNNNLNAIYSVILNNFDTQDLIKTAKVITYYKNFVEKEKVSLKEVVKNLAEKENSKEVSLVDFRRFSTSNDYLAPTKNLNESQSENEKNLKTKNSVNEYYHNLKNNECDFESIKHDDETLSK